MAQSLLPLQLPMLAKTYDWKAKQEIRSGPTARMDQGLPDYSVSLYPP